MSSVKVTIPVALFFCILFSGCMTLSPTTEYEGIPRPYEITTQSSIEIVRIFTTPARSGLEGLGDAFTFWLLPTAIPEYAFMGVVETVMLPVTVPHAIMDHDDSEGIEKEYNALEYAFMGVVETVMLPVTIPHAIMDHDDSEGIEKEYNELEEQ